MPASIDTLWSWSIFVVVPSTSTSINDSESALALEEFAREAARNGDRDRH
jgi:hypothetical protein